MRFLKNLILFCVIFLCAAFLSINSQTISIRMLPSQVNTPNIVLNLPAYIFMLAFIALGLCLGTLFEFLRARRDRSMSKKRLKEIENLTAKVNYLAKKKSSETDEILDLLK